MLEKKYFSYDGVNIFEYYNKIKIILSTQYFLTCLEIIIEIVLNESLDLRAYTLSINTDCTQKTRTYIFVQTSHIKYTSTRLRGWFTYYIIIHNYNNNSIII